MKTTPDTSVCLVQLATDALAGNPEAFDQYCGTEQAQVDEERRDGYTYISCALGDCGIRLAADSQTFTPATCPLAKSE